MSIKSAVLATVTSLVLMLVLGNEWVVEKATEGDAASLTRRSVTGSLRWQIWEMPSPARGATAAHLVILIVLTFILGGIAGRAPGLTALLGGWAAFLVASVVSLGIYGVIYEEGVGPAGTDAVDRFSSTAGFGAPLGMWLGWIVGLAVMIGSKTPVATTAGSHAPPPSWPPTTGHDPAAVSAPPPSYAPPGPSAPGPFSEPAAPSVDPAPAPGPPPSSPGGPVIGPPPDRTQVYPPHQDGS